MLFLGDCIEVMKDFESESMNMIFADPPYFLSNGGKSIKCGKVVSVNKGEWDKKDNYEDIEKFNLNWLEECYRILKVDGTIWISGTHHNIFMIKNILDKIGFKIINVIVWHKTTPPPLIYKNKFRFSYELIIWAKKGNEYKFNYEKMYEIYNKEMQDVWKLPAVQLEEKKFGYHPTQKPEKLLERIILSSTEKYDSILDPFMGSGTTCYVAKKLGRKYFGIEKEKKYFEIAEQRIDSID